MPKGNPNAQTIASDKYQKKAGYMTKGFKMKREIVERFENACAAAGITSQAGLIAKWMEEFCDEVEKNKNDIV